MIGDSVGQDVGAVCGGWVDGLMVDFWAKQGLGRLGRRGAHAGGGTSPSICQSLAGSGLNEQGCCAAPVRQLHPHQTLKIAAPVGRKTTVLRGAGEPPPFPSLPSLPSLPSTCAADVHLKGNGYLCNGWALIEEASVLQSIVLCGRFHVASPWVWLEVGEHRIQRVWNIFLGGDLEASTVLASGCDHWLHALETVFEVGVELATCWDLTPRQATLHGSICPCTRMWAMRPGWGGRVLSSRRLAMDESASQNRACRSAARQRQRSGGCESD
ncbi:uncharacterized protein PAC_11325 [Phialocephala subalpina]|uniref:Uncharacterized protein n=1 Tax=Phialocephala subalpina TaxID=576137 RepID=A0A1L7X8S8_9HELO|nr:uncharacterized protein PAC_11325 [Phialocephala subalpina]